ncbi:MAG TPA: PEP-CTERM sorting domain-containing protein, partial [Rubrivivax sp.]|nr:PEP-CTERM sorting domain-containing protein [Rubrivivax sp.]
MLELYDNDNMLIHSATLLVSARGSWDEVQLDVAGVRTMRILATWSAPNVFDGWWPNIDNIRFNETAQPAQVAEPGALALVVAALAGLAVTRRRRALLG